MLLIDELFDHVGEYFSRALQFFYHSFDDVVGVTGWDAFFDSCVPCLICIVSWWVWIVFLLEWWKLDDNYFQSASSSWHATDDDRAISNCSIVLCCPNWPCLALCVTDGAHGLALTFYSFIWDVLDVKVTNPVARYRQSLRALSRSRTE